MIMSDNKFNVCGLEQCGDINYRFQSHYLTVNNIKKSHHIHILQNIYFWDVSTVEKMWSEFICDKLREFMDDDQPGGCFGSSPCP